MEREAGKPTRHHTACAPGSRAALVCTASPGCSAGLFEGVMSSLCPVLYAQTPQSHQRMTTVSSRCARPFGRKAPGGALVFAPWGPQGPRLPASPRSTRPAEFYFNTAVHWLGKCNSPFLCCHHWNVSLSNSGLTSGQFSVLCTPPIPASFQTWCVFVQCN